MSANLTDKLTLTTAQTKPKRGNILANLEDHYSMVKLAGEHNADLILFPEMSITGYERDKAADLAFLPEDKRLTELRKLSTEYSIIIIAGAPIRVEQNLYIGAFLIKPDNSISIYTKQYLHEGEDEFFHSSFDFNPMFKVGEENAAMSICYDIENSLHTQTAAENNASFYLASIFYSVKGTPGAHQLLSAYAKQYSMKILMANFAESAWGRDSGGGSGFWDEQGKQVEVLNANDPGLLIVKKEDGIWKPEIIYV